MAVEVPSEGIGAAVRRVEDARLLTGRGRFVADLAAPGEVHARVVRSAHAHARLLGVHTSAALACAGVKAVLTAADLAADGVGPLRCLWAIRSRDGRPMAEPPRAALARERVRYVGEPVALVLASSPAAAVDGAERVEVDYDPLPAVTTARQALAPAAPLLHAQAQGNVAFRWTRGEEAAVAAAFARAAHVVRLDLVNNRLAGVAIEPRALLAVPDAAEDALTLYASTQVPHLVRRLVAAELGLAEQRLRVVAPDVGGGFGYKGKHYPEETLVAWAARRLRCPVKWVADRTESFLADTQGRDHLTHAELAVDADGVFLALRVQTLANLGAWVSTFGAAIPSAIYSALLAGVYRTPAIFVEVTGVFTNTAPTDAYRGAGRPEACYVLERLADQAARELGMDRAEIRRRNLVPAEAMPYRTPIGPVYDCGDFPRMLARALEISGYRQFAARRDAGARGGRLRGIGLACYVESSGVAPSRLAGALGARAGFFESAEVRVEPGGGVVARLGTHSHGQGHATTFAQILADRLGVPLSAVRIVEGDTAVVPFGTGTFGSRSLAVGGAALVRAADKVLGKCRRIAAHLLEASEKDLEFTAGRFTVLGTDRGVGLAQVARAAHLAHHLPDDVEPGLQELSVYDPPNFAFSNGVHVAEVEVDPEIGAVRLVGYWVVDDIGVVVNPMIVEGQIHGGLAQGIGQALLEACVYDASSGQHLSGSLMEYAVPRADHLPLFVSELDESQPCTHNPLGVKGCGESGAIGAPAAVVSAVLDALRPLGIEHADMPLTPARVWAALAAARRAPTAGPATIAESAPT